MGVMSKRFNSSNIREEYIDNSKSGWLCCRKTIEESTLTLNLIEYRLMIWKGVELNYCNH